MSQTRCFRLKNVVFQREYKFFALHNISYLELIKFICYKSVKKKKVFDLSFIRDYKLAVFYDHVRIVGKGGD